MLINAYVAELASARSAGTSRTSRPGVTPAASSARGRCRPRSRRTSSTPCSPTAPATTSTTRTRSTPRPECSTPLEAARCTTGPASSSSALDGGGAPAVLGRARRSSSTRTTPTARATPTAATRTTSSTAPCPSPSSPASSRRTSSPARSSPARARSAARRPARRDAAFEITQRADFFEEEVGLETTLKRPIINTRDEPHADPQKYRRLHVITGDANLAEVATFLKVGVTALVLLPDRGRRVSTRETRCSPRPVQAMHAVSHDPTLRTPLELADGETMTALEMQWELYDRGSQVRRGAWPRGARPRARSARCCSSAGRRCSTGSSPIPRRCATSSTGWRSCELIDAYCERHDCGFDDHRVARARPAVPRPAPGEVAVPAARRWSASSTDDDVEWAVTDAADDDPGVLPRRVPRSASARRSSLRTGIRSFSTSGGTRSGGCR